MLKKEDKFAQDESPLLVHGIPLTVHTAQQLDQELLNLGALYNVTGDLNEDDGQAFVYQVTMEFSDLFQHQVELMEMTVYDATVTLESIFKVETDPDKQQSNGKEMRSERRGSTAKTASQNAIEESMFMSKKVANVGEMLRRSKMLRIREASWLGFVSIHPNVSTDVETQAVRLAQAFPIDGITRNENGFIDCHDEQFVMRRLLDLADKHQSASQTYLNQLRIKEGKKNVSGNGGDVSLTDEMDRNGNGLLQRLPSKISGTAGGKKDLTMNPSSASLTSAAGSTSSDSSANHVNNGNAHNFIVDLSNDSKYASLIISLNKLRAFYQLRHIRCRDLKRKLLCVLNYFRSVQKRIAFDMKGFSQENIIRGYDSVKLINPNSISYSESGPANSRSGGVIRFPVPSPRPESHVRGPSRRDLNNNNNNNDKNGKNGNEAPPRQRSIRDDLATASSPILPSLHASFITPSDLSIDEEEFSATKSTVLENRYDQVSRNVRDELTVTDEHGIAVTYDAALTDLKDLEEELLKIATFYINKHENEFKAHEDPATAVDRLTVMRDLLECEYAYQDAKHEVLYCLYEIYDHSLDVAEQEKLAQAMTDLMAARPKLDFTVYYFTEAYAAEIVCLQQQRQIYRELIDWQAEQERRVVRQVYGNVTTKNRYSQIMLESARKQNQNAVQAAEDEIESARLLEYEALPDPLYREPGIPNIQLVPEGCSIGIFDVLPSLVHVFKLMQLVEKTFEEIRRAHKPESALAEMALKCSLLSTVQTEWRTMADSISIPNRRRSDWKALDNVCHQSLIDDPSAISVVILDLVTDIMSTSLKNSTISTEESPSSAKWKNVSHLNSELEIYGNMLELIRTRRDLLESIDNCDHLTAHYKYQAKFYGRQIDTVLLPPLKFEIEKRTTNTREPHRIETEFSSSGGVSGENRLASSEFDESLGEKLDFSDLSGLKHSVSVDGLEEVRALLQYQRVHEYMLTTAVQLNQVFLDSIFITPVDQEEDIESGPRTVGKRKQTDADAKPLNNNVPASDNSDEFGSPPGSPSSPMRPQLNKQHTERMLKRAPTTRIVFDKEKNVPKYVLGYEEDSVTTILRTKGEIKIRTDEMALIGRFFHDVAEKKELVRTPLVAIYREKAPRIRKLHVGRMDLIARETRKLRFELLRMCVHRLIPRLTNDSTKYQCIRVAEDMRLLALELPPSISPFLERDSDEVIDMTRRGSDHRTGSSDDEEVMIEPPAHTDYRPLLPLVMFDGRFGSLAGIPTNEQIFDLEGVPLNPFTDEQTSADTAHLFNVQQNGQLWNVMEILYHFCNFMGFCLFESKLAASGITVILYEEQVAKLRRAFDFYSPRPDIPEEIHDCLSDVVQKLDQLENAVRNVPECSKLSVVSKCVQQCAYSRFNRLILGLNRISSRFLNHQNEAGFRQVHQFVYELTHRSREEELLYRTYLDMSEWDKLFNQGQSQYRYEKPILVDLLVTIPPGMETDWRPCYPGRLPPRSLLYNVHRSFTSLKDSDRHYAAVCYQQHSDKLRDFLAAEDIDANQQLVQALEWENAYIRRAMSLNQLRLAYCCWLLDAPLPTTTKEHQKFQTLYQERIMFNLKKPDRHFRRGSSAEQLDDEQQFKADLKAELRLQDQQIRRIRTELDKLMISDSIDLLDKEYSALLTSITEHRPELIMYGEKFLMEDSDRQDGDKTEEETQHKRQWLPRRREEGLLWTCKVPLIQHFVHRLRNRGTWLVTQTSPSSYLFSEEDLKDCVDQLARGLVVWAEEELRNRLESATMVTQQLQHLLYLKDKDVVAVTHQLELLKTDINNQVNAALSDKAYRLIFDLDQKQRQLRDLKEEMKKQEVKIREKIRKEYDALVKELTMDIVGLKSKFSEYRTGMYNKMVSSMSSVKKDALTRLVDYKNMPVEVKQEQSERLLLEEQMDSIKEENRDLQRLILRIKTLYHMRYISVKNKLSKELKQALERVEASRTVWDQLAESETRGRLLRDELVSTQQALTTAEQSVSRLRRQLELTHQQRQGLQHWKSTKAHRLDELEQKVKRYEALGVVDVDKLLSELEKKDKRIDQLTLVEQDSNKKADVVESKADRTIRKLQKQLEREQSLKLEAFSRLEAIRSEIEGGEYDPDNAGALWRSRYMAMSELNRQLESENQMLKQSIRDGTPVSPNDFYSSSKPYQGESTPQYYDSRPSSEGGIIGMATQAVANSYGRIPGPPTSYMESLGGISSIDRALRVPNLPIFETPSERPATVGMPSSFSRSRRRVGTAPANPQAQFEGSSPFSSSMSPSMSMSMSMSMSRQAGGGGGGVSQGGRNLVATPRSAYSVVPTTPRQQHLIGTRVLASPREGPPTAAKPPVTRASSLWSR